MMILTRFQAIHRLLEQLRKMMDPDNAVSGDSHRKRLYCRDLKRLSDQELFDQYQGIAANLNTHQREKLEEYVNLWQISQQLSADGPFACYEAPCPKQEPCQGWDSFTTDQLEQYVKEILGETAHVVDEPLICS